MLSFVDCEKVFYILVVFLMNEIETFYGLIETTLDSLRVFQCCREGKLGRIRRRLYDRERKLIRSGSVFVFNEVESGIKRWTDGRLWSPSRIYGNFLIYRELESKGVPGAVSSFVARDMIDEGDGIQKPHQLQEENIINGNNQCGDSTIESLLRQQEQSPEMIQWIKSRESLLESKFKNSTRKLGSQSTTFLKANQASTGSMPNTTGSNEMLRGGHSAPNSYSLGFLGEKEAIDLFDHYFENGFPSSSNTSSGENTEPAASHFADDPMATSSSAGTPPPPAGTSRYRIKKDGLIKKTISVVMDSQTYHLVCYYNKRDFMIGRSNLAHFPQV